LRFNLPQPGVSIIRAALQLLMAFTFSIETPRLINVAN
jgi:hypothetical protein